MFYSNTDKPFVWVAAACAAAWQFSSDASIHRKLQLPEDIHCELGHLAMSHLQQHAGKRIAQTYLFKEVIQPQVPLRLPCYDFVPVMDHTVVTVLLS